jgi:cbb3-type cytochrome oxidase subunit 1
MVFSVMLIAPSWGGMLNGLLTLRGAWDKVRQDPMLKFMVVAVTAYGMATLEGPCWRSRASTRCRTTPTGPSPTCTPARWAGTAS